MKIALGVNKNYVKVDDVLNALQEFKDMGAEKIQCVNSIEEIEENGEKFAVYEIEPCDGVLNILLHNNTIINFLKKEK